MIRIFGLLGFLLLGMACNRPLAKFSYSGNPVAPATLRFSNQSQKAEQYRWNFGDGSSSEQAEPTHRFGSSGNYEVALTAIRGKRERTSTARIQIKAPERCLVEINTPEGLMLVELSDATPRHRDNFLKLAGEGFFDSLLFHRVIEGFMIQGGDPESRDAPTGKPLGMGGPGYTVPAEFVDTLIHLKGALAAARKGDPVNPKRESSGSQFYLVQGRVPTGEELDRFEAGRGKRYSAAQREAYLQQGGTPFLDGKYTVFGKVVEGLEVIDRIAARKTGRADRPVTDVWMTIRIIR